MLNNHLVFEGIDRIGKSTLLAAVAAATGATAVKMRVPKTLAESKSFYWDHFRLLANSKDPIIWDRGHLSELVYAPLYRPSAVEQDWTDTLRRHFPEMLKRVTVVYCQPGSSKSLNLLKEDERRGADRLAELALFESELRQCPWPVCRITSHEVVYGQWIWRPLHERVSEVLYTADMGVPAGLGI